MREERAVVHFAVSRGTPARQKTARSGRPDFRNFKRCHYPARTQSDFRAPSSYNSSRSSFRPSSKPQTTMVATVVMRKNAPDARGEEQRT